MELQKISAVDHMIDCEGTTQATEDNGSVTSYLVQGKSCSEEKSSEAQTLINMMKAAMGVGLLAYPYLFYQGGYVCTSLLVMLTASSIYRTNRLMLDVTQDLNPTLSFDQVILRVLGPAFTSLYRLLIVLLTCFTCIAYLIYISCFLGKFLSLSLALHTSQVMCLMLSGCVFVPLSLIKDMKNFYLSSILGNVLMYSIVFFLLTLFCMQIHTGQHQPLQQDLLLGQPLYMPVLFGTSLFAYEIFTVVSPIRLSMKDPSRMPHLLKHNVILITGLLILFGILGSLALTVPPKPNYFMSVEGASWLLVVEALYAVVLIVSYPLQLYPAYQILEKTTLGRSMLGSQESKNYENRFRAMKIGCNLFLLFLTTVAPDFEHVLNIGGALGGSLVQFVIPVILYQTHFQEKVPAKTKMCNYALMVGGVAAGGVSLTYSLVNTL